MLTVVIYLPVSVLLMFRSSILACVVGLMVDIQLLLQLILWLYWSTLLALEVFLMADTVAQYLAQWFKTIFIHNCKKLVYFLDLLGYHAKL